MRQKRQFVTKFPAETHSEAPEGKSLKFVFLCNHILNTEPSLSTGSGYFYELLLRLLAANIHAFVDTAPTTPTQQMFQEKRVMLAHMLAGDLEIRVKMIVPGFIWI